PSRMPLLASRLAAQPRGQKRGCLPAAEELDLRNLAPGRTPSYRFLRKVAEDRFTKLAEVQSRLSASTPRLIVAYSIKTNPHPAILQLAKQSGFLVEAISSSEVELALEQGFSTAEIILTGPAKELTTPVLGQTFAGVFADSLIELRSWRRLAEKRRFGFTGFRFRSRIPPS